jgi:hypothetical protein
MNKDMKAWVPCFQWKIMRLIDDRDEKISSLCTILSTLLLFKITLMTRRDGLLYYYNTNNCPKYFAYVYLLVYDVTLAYQEFEFMTDDVIDLLSESESSEEGKPSLNALRTSCMKSIISIAKVDEARYAAA